MIKGKFNRSWWVGKADKLLPTGKIPAEYMDDGEVVEGDEEETALLKYGGFTEEAELAALAEMPSFRMSTFITNIMQIPDEEGKYAPFSFRGRKHLPAIYDTPARFILLCCARQVEKCVEVSHTILTENGPRAAGDISVGDRVLTYREGSGKLEWGPVVWKSEVIYRDAVKITLQGGVSLICGLDHPLRTYREWTKAGELKVGDRVEVANQPPDLPENTRAPSEEALRAGALDALRLCGVAVHPEGKAPQLVVTVRHSKYAAPVLMEMMHQTGTTYEGKRPTPNAHWRLALGGRIGKWLASAKSMGMKANLSGRMGKAAAQMAVKLMWLCSGVLAARRNASGSLEMHMECSDLETVKEIRAIHLQAGIELGMGEKRRPGHVGWKMRPIGRGKRALVELLPKGMVEDYPEVQAESEDDTLPSEWGRKVHEAYRNREVSEGDPTKEWEEARHSNPRLGVQRSAARRMIDTLLKAPGAAPEPLLRLKREVEAPTRWSRVVKVEPLGQRQMVDLQVKDTESFVVEGIVTHNSTYLGNRLLVSSVAYPGYKSLYVSPSSIQTKTFSSDRLRNPIETSPFLRDFARAGGVQNVLEMEFGNSSKITMRSAYLSADRCRGIPAYLLCLDEFQDLLPEHIPVIEPCTSHAPKRYRTHLYAGTPKSFDNNMEFYRSGFVADRPMSTMGEWMVPCDNCGSKALGGFRFWQCLGTPNIQKNGLSCSRCGAALNPQHEDAQWHHQQKDGRFESYRIPQLMVPWRPWDEIYTDFQNFDNARFHNEVLGLSMDSHSRPLSMSEIRACCDPKISLAMKDAFLPEKWHEPIFMGVDWGSGTLSYTVMTLGTYVGGIFTVFYMQRFTGLLLDTVEQINHILHTLRRFRVVVAGTDFGYGQLYNDHLIRNYGRDKVAVFQHLGRVTKKVAYDPRMQRFKLFRSAVMADMINMIKRKNIRFPRWEDMREPFAKDFCNITAELSETQQMIIYSHRPDRPDDSFHSVLYCLLASTLVIQRPDVFSPLHNRYRQGPVRDLGSPLDQG